ncbi:MAG: hypothetical protein R6U96_09815 [Promethearchaeia archaeon]
MMKLNSLPLYSQLTNCCGLSTFLMLLNPRENIKYKNFLEDLYEKIQFLMPQEKKEFRWSVVLDYLLLKTLGDNRLTLYLEEKLNETFINYRAIMNFELKKLIKRPFRKVKRSKKFFEENKVNPFILRKSLYKMRTDMDLKILFSLFGGDFYPQQQQNYDGTGSLYFTPHDFEETKKYKEKLRIMESHLETLNSGIPCIALNMGFHWVAITEVNSKNTLIKYNNPLGGKGLTRKITKFLSEEYRFYLFSHKPNDAFILKDKIKEFLFRELQNRDKKD